MINSFVQVHWYPESWKDYLLFCFVTGILVSVFCIPITVTYLGCMFGIEQAISSHIGIVVMVFAAGLLLSMVIE